MKKSPLICLLLVTAISSARATSSFSYSYSGPAYTVPDGNPNGVFSSISVSGAAPSIVDVMVTLNLSGGYNGDLYGYLSYGGSSVPLLDRIGVSSANPFGANGAGMNVLLSDGGAGNIHAAGDGFLSGTYRPDGQSVSPLSPPTSFNPNGGPITLAGTFMNFNPNGTWTLFLADVVSSGNPSTLNSWGLQITAVPEPDALQLGLVTLILYVVLRRSVNLIQRSAARL